MATGSLTNRPRTHNVQLTCWRCGKTGDLNFYQSKAITNKITHTLPQCKKCCAKQYNDYYKKNIDHNYCVFLMCRLFNYAYKKCVSEGATKEYVEKKHGENPFVNYLGKIQAFGKQKKLILNCFEDGETDYNSNLDIKEDENIFRVTGEIEYKWGTHFNLEEYEFLNTRYLEYCQHINIDIRTMESLVEEICHTELRIRKARADNSDIVNMQGLTKCLQDLLKTAGLDSKSKREMDSLDAIDTYGMRIKQIEEEEPAIVKELVPLYTDSDNIVKLLKKHVLRSLKNLLLGSRDFNVSDTDDLDE